MTGNKPSFGAVVGVLTLAVASIVAGVYFGGHGQLPIAMTCSVLFVVLGGLGFEMARRRSA